MFKNRAIQMKVVKDSAANQTATDLSVTESVDKLIEKISKINVTRVAIGLVAVYASVVAVNTASEIAINIAPKN